MSDRARRDGWRARTAIGCAATGVLIAGTGLGMASAATSGGVSPIGPGSYRGTVTDAGGEPPTYTATIRITAAPLRAGRVAGTVRYSAAFDPTTFAPALACRGTLRYTGRSRNGVRFRESIAGGAVAQCISGGTVTLTRLNARSLAYVWTMRGFNGPTPTGRLVRQAGAR